MQQKLKLNSSKNVEAKQQTKLKKKKTIKRIYYIWKTSPFLAAKKPTSAGQFSGKQIVQYGKTSFEIFYNLFCLKKMLSMSLENQFIT